MSFPDHGRVLFSATLVRGHIAKFHIPYLKWFKERGWETWVAAKNDYPDGKCEIPYCDRFVDIDFARSPCSRQTLIAYRQLRDMFATERFDIVHAHTPVGGVLTRLAARDGRKAGTKIIYTAHGFHFYRGAPLVNWLLWYPIERAMSHFTDVLVTINREDYERAKRFSSCRVEYAPGVGVDLSRFVAVEPRRDKREELGIEDDDFAVLAIGDLNANKNHRVLIEAMAMLPANVRLFIAGDGPLRNELEALAERLGVAGHVNLLGFRSDIDELLKACDVFCLPSKREGLPVSLIEAMASGLPVIASAIRGISPDLIEDGRSGYLLREPSPECVYDAINRVMNNEAEAAVVTSHARETVQRFDIRASLGTMAAIYLRVLVGNE